MACPGVIGSYSDLKGKRVFITGGSAGIGRATALAFDENGAIVTVMGRRLHRLEEVVRQLKHGYAVVGDMNKEEDCKRTIAEAIEKMGGLDILVNNGGVTNPDMMEQPSAASSFISAFGLHVSGTVTFVNAAEEELIKNKGSVINVSSVAARIAMPPMASYSVAKAAQDALTVNLALKYGEKHVRVNSVLPGAIRTEAVESMAERQGKTMEEMAESFGKKHALLRIAEPSEVAALILFLASNASSFITGTNIPVDGGALLKRSLNEV